ncbi:hypothetical protein F3Y22_tig00111309pilonHSYRG00080 [Hibiscus syriacus]|uniref:RNase H type-1 domain-containing protein n=1 Tax=Hibiscus syriacus TaxID=106335 RepID=A0A6A2YR11_HIBSY|nr:hypothetical protein F3Y22_tig00111309pilonHSYRG00080 [Hibiscus syriacus]
MLTNNHSFPTCGAATETVIHVIRDYPPSRHLWLRIVPQSACSNFFGTDLHSWITQNINMQRPLRDGDPSWFSFFAALIWLIWKQMNDYVFKGAIYKTNSILHSSYSWVKCYETNIKTPAKLPRERVAVSTWSPPPQEWMCLNMDGVVTLDGRGSIGGVLCNSTGDWIKGFTKNIGTTSVLHAELWSIYEGLLISRSVGFLDY